jgi:hypothetical protein
MMKKLMLLLTAALLLAGMVLPASAQVQGPPEKGKGGG